MRKLELSGHLEAFELYERYRLATDGVLRSHYQMMWHLAEGMWVSECAAATGYTRRWIEKLAQRYNAEGPEALGDRRRRNKGARPLLDAAQLAALAEVVSAPPPDGGLWSGRKVAAWIATEIGRAHVHPQRGWAYLRRLDLTWQTPRPAHDRAATPEAQAAYKKLRDTVDQARTAHPQGHVEVWAFDEHRLGLKPLTRRVWAPKGRRPLARGRHRFQWLYLYGFVRPASGQVVWFLFNTVNVEAFQATLEAFAREVGAGPDKIVILVIDNAGWHISERITPPDGVRLAFLPPYTPELQPAERLWPLANEAVANHSFPDLATLGETIARRCLTLCDNPDIIQGATLWHWWPETMNAN